MVLYLSLTIFLLFSLTLHKRNFSEHLKNVNLSFFYWKFHLKERILIFLYGLYANELDISKNYILPAKSDDYTEMILQIVAVY